MVKFKINVRFRVRVNFRVRVSIKNRVMVRIVFRVREWFPLSIQWRSTIRNLSYLTTYLMINSKSDKWSWENDPVAQWQTNWVLIPMDYTTHCNTFCRLDVNQRRNGDVLIVDIVRQQRSVQLTAEDRTQAGGQRRGNVGVKLLLQHRRKHSILGSLSKILCLYYTRGGNVGVKLLLQHNGNTQSLGVCQKYYVYTILGVAMSGSNSSCRTTEKLNPWEFVKNTMSILY